MHFTSWAQQMPVGAGDVERKLVLYSHRSFMVDAGIGIGSAMLISFYFQNIHSVLLCIISHVPAVWLRDVSAPAGGVRLITTDLLRHVHLKQLRVVGCAGAILSEHGTYQPLPDQGMASSSVIADGFPVQLGSAATA